MRIACLAVALVVGAGLLVRGTTAQNKDNEVTLKGTILCAKCALKEGTSCRTAVQVKEGNKDVVYYFNDKGNQEVYHEEVCGGARHKGTVQGKVAEKDGKKWITPTKVSYDKK
jgi:hypothetical protein